VSQANQRLRFTKTNLCTCFYPRDAMLERVFARATCPSVRLSDTRRYCDKTKKTSVMISSPSGSSTILVFFCQISSQNSKGVTPSEGVKPGWGRQNKSFSSFEWQYIENGQDSPKLLLITNMKLLMIFRFAPRLLTSDDLELLYKFEFS